MGCGFSGTLEVSLPSSIFSVCNKLLVKSDDSSNYKKSSGKYKISLNKLNVYFTQLNIEKWWLMERISSFFSIDVTLSIVLVLGLSTTSPRGSGSSGNCVDNLRRPTIIIPSATHTTQASYDGRNNGDS
uniref:Uncharacterized protein n=1 Tax=Strongyloides papillosus TaxID=174720 RepID=A0A0N5CAW3_STREA